VLFDSSVKPNGEGEITSLLTLAGVEVTLSSPVLCKSTTGSACEENATDIEVSPDKLPWHTLLVLAGPEPEIYEDILYSAEYVVICLDLGIKVSDECTTQSEAAGGAGIKLLNVTGGVEIEHGAPITPYSNCSDGGKEKGKIEFAAENLTTPTEGGTLTISSE
jgi:hypothetical protein